MVICLPFGLTERFRDLSDFFKLWPFRCFSPKRTPLLALPKGPKGVFVGQKSAKAACNCMAQPSVFGACSLATATALFGSFADVV